MNMHRQTPFRCLALGGIRNTRALLAPVVIARHGAAHDGMPYVERGAGERHAGPHEVIAGTTCGGKRAQLGQGT